MEGEEGGWCEEDAGKREQPEGKEGGERVTKPACSMFL